MSTITTETKIGIQPRLNTPLLKSFHVSNGPPGLLGRYFLNVDTSMRARGIELSFASLAELRHLYEQNKDNWGFFNPMFDPQVAEVSEANAICLVGRDTSGEIVASTSGKLLVAENRTIKELVDAGDLFAIRPEANVLKISTLLDAPDVNNITGRFGYCGSVWVRPDYRGQRLPAVFARTVNACLRAMHGVDYVLGSVRPDVVGTELHDNYGFKHHQGTFTIIQGDTILTEAHLLWMDHAELERDLIYFLNTLWPKIDAAVVARRR
jgi:hypothetical protein